jgi:hypothetical protein
MALTTRASSTVVPKETPSFQNQTMTHRNPKAPTASASKNTLRSARTNIAEPDQFFGRYKAFLSFYGSHPAGIADSVVNDLIEMRERVLAAKPHQDQATWARRCEPAGSSFRDGAENPDEDECRREPPRNIVAVELLSGPLKRRTSQPASFRLSV